LLELENKKKEAMDLEDKIQVLKEVHQKRQQRRKTQKTLGDSDSDNEDAMSWVQKAKSLREEKAFAEKRAVLLAQIEAEEQGSDSDDDPVGLRMVKRQGNTNASAVEGVKVLHQLDEFQEGVTILTLADSKIVEGGTINDEDELEAINLVETWKTKKNNAIRAGKRKYDVYGEDRSDILPQYDSDDPDKEKQERKKKAFMLGEQGDVQLSSEEKLQKLRENLQASERAVAAVDGTVIVREASDYYTKEELVPFKKSKKGNKVKKRRLRQKPISEQLAPLGDAQDKDQDADLGSRSQRETRQKSKKLEDVISALEKRDNYKEAVRKPETDAKWLFEEEDDEDELYKSLARTRKLVQRERKKREEIIVEQVEKAQQDKREAKKKDTRLSFNATTEFIRSIPKAPHGDSSDSDENMDVAEEKDEETFKSIEAIHIKQKERGNKKKRQENDQMDIETETPKEPEEGSASPKEPFEPIEALMGAEPLVSSSMSAVLQLLKSHGGTPALSLESMTGRASDKKVEEVNTDGDTFRLDYLDERGRAMTPKEAFRRLSYRFHGKAPGKNKDERRMKREEEDLRRKMMSTTDTPLGTLSAIQRTQQQSKLPYVIMGGNTTKILAQKPSLATTGTNDTEAHRGKGTFKEIPIERVPAPPRPKKEEEKKEKVSFGFKQ